MSTDFWQLIKTTFNREFIIYNLHIYYQQEQFQGLDDENKIRATICRAK